LYILNLFPLYLIFSYSTSRLLNYLYSDNKISYFRWAINQSRDSQKDNSGPLFPQNLLKRSFKTGAVDRWWKDICWTISTHRKWNERDLYMNGESIKRLLNSQLKYMKWNMVKMMMKRTVLSSYVIGRSRKIID